MDLHLSTFLPSFKEKEASLYKITPDEILPHLFLCNSLYSQSLLDKINTATDLDASGITILICSSSFDVAEKNNPFNRLSSSPNYKHLILSDSLDEDIAHYFNDSYQFIENALNHNKNIFVFCAAGVSRSPSIIIAYLRKKFDLTFEQAYNHVIFKRPCIDPNKNYIAQLKAYNPTQSG